MQPRYRLMLLPVDVADVDMAAAHAAALATATGATVAILGVIDTSAGFQFGAEGAAAYARLRGAAQAAIEAASAAVRGASVARIEHLIMDGVPSQAILEVADEQGADLIVLGAGRAMLGAASPETVIAQVIRHARCPVLIVPEERMNR